MNGVHDMGGMQNMGPVQPEKNEPVFHERWEGRVLALMLASGAWRKWNIDAMRCAIESIAPAEYLRMSYYEKWLTALTEQVVDSGLATRAEIDSGKPARGSTKAVPPLTADKVPPLVANGAPANRNAPAVARFKAGQRVRARNMHPVGATRLVRYARGKQGTIERDHGIFVFPDSNARFQGEKPQHVYSVRFAARELWGDQASPRDAVYIDMWDDYLEPA